MVRMGADTQMETFFARNLDEVPGKNKSATYVHFVLSPRLQRSVVDVLVGTDASGFESFGTQLFVFVGDQVDAAGEFIDVGTLATEVENSDLGVGHTTVEARFGVGLVFAVAVTPGRTTSHGEGVSEDVVGCEEGKEEQRVTF